MKLSATVSALVLSALASTSGTEALSGGRRSVSLNNNNAVVAGGAAANLVKRVSLDQMKEASNMKKVKRQPLPNAAPIAAAAGFGAIPSMNDGTMPVVGLSKRQESFGAHNGKQGTHVVSQNSVKSSNNGSSSSGSSSSTSSSSSSDSSDDADAEECDDEEDGEDDAEDCEEDDGDDDEECEEDDSADDDAEDCDEEDDGADDEEDCDEEEDASTSSSTSSSTDDNTVAATANVNVNLKQSNNNNNNNNNNDNKDNGSSSSSSKQNNQKGEQTRAWSSSASATKTSSSSKSEATDSSSSADGQSYTGIATWYTQNGNAGACGTVNPDSARIIALYTSAYANGDNCGRSVVIKNLDDGTQTTATVADMCPSCGGPQDIDLSVGAFQAIDPEYQTHGVRNIEWYFTD